MKRQKKIPASNSVNENFLNNKNVSNNIKTLNQNKINFINLTKIKNLFEIIKNLNQNQMNKIDLKKFKRSIFLDYSSNPNLLNNQINEEKIENNNNLNINNKINDDVKMEVKKLGRKKKRTEENILKKEEKECLVTCNNGIIKIIEEDSNTFPSSNEIKLNFEVKKFFKFLDIKKNKKKIIRIRYKLFFFKTKKRNKIYFCS